MGQVNRYLPDFIRLAPHANLRIVQATAKPVKESFGIESPGVENITKAQQAWAGTQALRSSRPAFELGTPASWRELTDKTIEIVDRHIDRCDVSGYSRLRETETKGGLVRSEKPSETISRLKEVAMEGIVTTTAFLEVVGKVAAPEDFDEPNREVAELALSSLGLISEWARVHGGKIDYGLVYALASPKPKAKKGYSALFKDLHFGAEWFSIDNGRVIVNPVMAHKLRNRHGKPLIRINQNDRELFGCAFLPEIPRMGKFMVQGAAKGGLFGQTYEETRQGLTEN